MKSWLKLRPRYLTTRRWYDKDTLIEHFVFELAMLYFEEEMYSIETIEPNRKELLLIKKAVDWWNQEQKMPHEKTTEWLYQVKENLYKKYGFNDFFEANFKDIGESKGLRVLEPRNPSDFMSAEDLSIYNRVNDIIIRGDTLFNDRLERHLSNIIKFRWRLWT